MEQTLLSRKELAERWGISTSTLDRRVREGMISPVKSMKTPQFSLECILKVEGVDKLSPLERRRLEREIQSLQNEIKQLEEEKEQMKRLLTNTVADLSQKLREV
ncbi:MAG: histidine kinase [Tissierella sp.]|nr:histidine kinase [Tissierella sp.]